MHNLFVKNKMSSLQVRSISKYLDRDKTAKVVRQRFIDYFVKENDHAFVRSSPVVPYCDPTVAFVNAGMNQVFNDRAVGVCVFFKRILYLSHLPSV